MLSCYSPFTKTKFDRTLTLAATRRSLPSQYHLRHASFSPAVLQPVSNDWPQGDCRGAASRRALSTQLPHSYNRFDWRLRASSRMQKQEKKDMEADTEIQKPPLRKRLQGVKTDLVGPDYHAFQDYKTRFLSLLQLEEAEEAAALKQRLSTWGIERLEREGYCMTGLYACWREENQFGKPVASLSLGPGLLLPDNKLEMGTQVLLSRLDPLKEAPEVGSIIRRKDSVFHICFPSQFDLSGSWRMDLGLPNLMYDRMRSAVSFLSYDPNVFQNASSDSEEFILQGTELRDVLLRSFQQHSSGQVSDVNNSETLGGAAVVESQVVNSPWKEMGAFKNDQRIVSWAERYIRPCPVKMDNDPPIDLNASQMQAMAAMIGRRISLIQGPPGTGKTKTIIETIKLLKIHFEVPQPILVCTYTNVAVDNLVEGLAKVGVKPLRVGSQGNIRASLIPHSLDYKMQMHHLYPTFKQVTEEVDYLAKEIRELGTRYAKSLRKIKEQEAPTKRGKTRLDNMFKDLEMKRLRLKGIKRKRFAIEQQMLRDVVADADVICTTCITAACSSLNIVDFPVVFLDEASMSTEPASLIPIMKGSQHLALIGDHKQLPPVIISKEAKEGGLNLSLFERLTEEGHVHSVMLDTQYRMHPDIAQFPAAEFYNLALRNGTVDHTGNPLPGLEPPRSTHLNVKNKVYRPSVIFVDHGGNECMKGRSRVNITEARLVASLAEDLLLVNKDLQGRDIGIIAPYAAQITLLLRFLNNEPQYRERFKSVLGVQRAMQMQHIEVKTVDGFEGREKEVIIFSTVRNNEGGHIGFLADKKRLNVGLTRAKRGLFVLGSISTLRAGRPEYDEGIVSVSEGYLQPAPIDDKKESVVETKKKKKGRGHESWQRYAQFMLDKNNVISLQGHKLHQFLEGHWDALPQEIRADAFAEVRRLDVPNQRLYQRG